VIEDVLHEETERTEIVDFCVFGGCRMKNYRKAALLLRIGHEKHEKAQKREKCRRNMQGRVSTDYTDWH